MLAEKVARPRRYKRALLRLSSGKTEHVVWHIAKKLQEDGLVVITSAEGASALPCSLTERGKSVVRIMQSGTNPYASSSEQLRSPRNVKRPRP